MLEIRGAHAVLLVPVQVGSRLVLPARSLQHVLQVIDASVAVDGNGERTRLELAAKQRRRRR